jgi:hypothetical protein
VKRVAYLVLAAMVALMIFVPVAAMAQETQPKAKIEETRTVEREATMPLPKSGGPSVGTAGMVLLPAAALLLGSGVLVYAVVRRR